MIIAIDIALVVIGGFIIGEGIFSMWWPWNDKSRIAQGGRFFRIISGIVIMGLVFLRMYYG